MSTKSHERRMTPFHNPADQVTSSGSKSPAAVAEREEGLGMVPNHGAPDRIIELRTTIAAPGSSRSLPFIAVMPAVAGLLLVIVGLLPVPPLISPTLQDWQRPQALRGNATIVSRPISLAKTWSYLNVTSWSFANNARVGDQRMSRKISRVISAASNIRMPRSPNPASRSLRPFRHDSDDRISRALFPGDSEPSVPGLVRSDLKHKERLAHGCADTYADSSYLAPLPLCHDLRDDLAAMAAMLRGGGATRWAGTAAAVPARAANDDRINNLQSAPLSVGNAL